MFVERVKPSQLNNRLNSESNAPWFLQNAEIIRSCGIKTRNLGDLVIEPINNSIRNISDEFISGNGDVPLFRPADMDGFWLKLESAPLISAKFEERHKKARVYPGDIVLAIAGTVGSAARVPPNVKYGNVNGSCARIKTQKEINAYLLAYLNSKFGNLSLNSLAVGSVQKHLNLEDLPTVPIVTPHEKAQAYIGEKVRQAERLRARAQELKQEIDDLVSLPHIEKARQTINDRYNRAAFADLEPRLDSKFYNRRSLAILKASRKNAVELNSLIESISNGFEHRSFTDTGKPYITVTEVSSGRLNLQTAPLIAEDVSVPAKAKVNEKCVLVVRTGSIGIAVKVFSEDSGAVISSHLIRLEFETEKLAAASAAFLNSSAGKDLLKRISYGAVQPQIGQDELLKLPIPQEIIERSEDLLELKNRFETATRASEKLTTAAKYLVEGLIEGKITEEELINAEEALSAGEREPDKQVMSRLTRKGMGISGEARLFPDLDALYAALDETQRGENCGLSPKATDIIA